MPERRPDSFWNGNSHGGHEQLKHAVAGAIEGYSPSDSVTTAATSGVYSAKWQATQCPVLS